MQPAPQTRQLTVTAPDGCSLRVSRWGLSEQSLILIHGFGEHGHSWGEPPPQLTSAYSLFAVDLRGHGDSQWDPGAQYRLDKFVSDLTVLIDHLHLDSFCLVGHSLGASIALRLATLRPRRVRKLVLVELHIEALAPEVLEHMLAQFNAQFRVYDSPEEYHTLLEGQRPAADREALLRFARHSLRPRQAGGYELKCDPALRRLLADSTDARELARDRYELSAVDCPLLLVRGSGSAILTRTAGQQIVSLVADARLAEVPGAGHSIMLDRPREFAQIVTAFLQ